MRRAVIIFALLLALFVGCTIPEYGSNCDVAYPAMCFIDTPTGTGSAVLLDTGYMLTAGHVVDADENRVIDERDEKVLSVQIGDAAEIHSATIVASVYKPHEYGEDFCILKVDAKDLPRGVKTRAYKSTTIGEPVFCLGSMNNDKTHMTVGVISHPEMARGLPRASCSVWPGSSGGGVFDEDQNLLGIVIYVGMFRGMEVHNAPPYMTYDIYMPDWCEFVPIERIAEHAKNRGLLRAVVLND